MMNRRTQNWVLFLFYNQDYNYVKKLDYTWYYRYIVTKYAKMLHEYCLYLP